MSPDPPFIDDRDEAKVLEQILGLVPNYVPQWKPGENRSGRALAKIFSGIAATIIQRLNQAPDKNFTAYLVTLGVELFPPRPAQAPVTFFLPGDAEKHVLVPAKTQVTAGDVVFESQQDLLAAPARLSKLYTVVPGNDQILKIPPFVSSGKPNVPFETRLSHDAEKGDTEVFVENPLGFKAGDWITLHNPGNNANSTELNVVSALSDDSVKLLGKIEKNYNTKSIVEKLVLYPLYKGKNIQDHILYIGHEDVLNLKGEFQINLNLNLTNPEFENVENVKRFVNSVTWQYYGKEKEGKEDWHQMTAFLVNTVLKLTAKKKGEIEKKEINGIQSRWIRCRVNKGKIKEMENIKITAINFPKTNNNNEISTTPDMAFYNDIPLDLTKNSILPFGEKPQLYDTFYLASKEVFSKKGAEITIKFTIPEDKDNPNDENDKKDTLNLSWEYWNGSGWVNIVGLTDNTDKFRYGKKSTQNCSKDNDKTVTFICPEDLEKIEVNGQENWWIRVRIAAGNYGEAIYKKVNDHYEPDYSQVKPPEFTMILLSYAYDKTQPVQHCLTQNNLVFKDVCKEDSPFISLPPEDKPAALYFGFDKKIEDGPIRMIFSFDEFFIPTENPVEIKWYYSSLDKDWTPMEISDDTNSLTQTGIISFFLPPDFSAVSRFGEKLYWLKAVIGQGGNTGCPELPDLKGVYINTVDVEQTESIENEILGSGTFQAGQWFQIRRTPIVSEQIWVDETGTLTAEEEKYILKKYGIDYIKKEIDKTGKITDLWVRWHPLPDFFDSTAHSRVYVIHRVSGQVRFGDGIHGKIPPPGKNNIKITYQVGGGQQGNVPAYEISALRSALTNVERVANTRDAVGGLDVETLDSFRKRAPQVLRHRYRAVTAEDFQRIAFSVSSAIARTKCITSPNRVEIIVLPKGKEKQPVPSYGLKKKIKDKLLECCLNTLLPQHLQIEPPRYKEVSVTAEVCPVSIDMIVPLKNKILETLNRFLHPITGGFDHKGWDFGRGVYESDIYSLIEGIDGVDYVEIQESKENIIIEKN